MSKKTHAGKIHNIYLRYGIFEALGTGDNVVINTQMDYAFDRNKPQDTYKFSYLTAAGVRHFAGHEQATTAPKAPSFKNTYDAGRSITGGVPSDTPTAAPSGLPSSFDY